MAAGLFPGAASGWGSGSATVGKAKLFPEALPVSSNTWFDLASLTKPLATTTLTLLAFRSGTMRPNMAIGEVLPRLRGSRIADLEVQELLTHTSGLPAWLPLYCLCEGRAGALQTCLSAIDLDYQPGSRVEYSCIGFVILGLMLENISGSRFQDLFCQQIVDPLGLGEELGFLPNQEKFPVAGGAFRPLAEERLVEDLGLDRRWIPAIEPGLPDDGNSRFLGGSSGNAGLFGTVDGVYRLSSEYSLGGGSLLTAEEVALATRNHTSGLEQARGYGWQMAASPGCSAGPSLTDFSIGHTGFTGPSVWLEPDDGMARVLLCNRNHPNHHNSNLHPIRRRFHTLTS